MHLAEYNYKILVVNEKVIKSLLNLKCEIRGDNYEFYRAESNGSEGHHTWHTHSRVKTDIIESKNCES